MASPTGEGAGSLETSRFIPRGRAKISDHDAGRQRRDVIVEADLHVRLVLLLAQRHIGNLLLQRYAHATKNTGDVTHPRQQDRDRLLLACAGGEQVNGVDAFRLPEPLDAADALLEADRRPWQLEIDDQPAPVMEVQPFAGRVGRQQQARFARHESSKCLVSLAARQPSMQLGGREVAEVVRQATKRVAIFSEHNRRLVRASKETLERTELRLALLGQTRQSKKMLEQAPLLRPIRKPRRAQLGRGLVILVSGHEGERDLQQVRTFASTQQSQPRFERPRQRRRAAAGATREDRHRQPRA
jgi:hypothetical protein